MRIWFPKPLGDDVIDELQSLVPGNVISKEPDEETEVLIEGRVTREQIEQCPKLKTVIIPFAGVSPAMTSLMREFPNISLHNLHHNAQDTAETALALLFAASKQIVPMDQSMRKHDWTPRYSPEQARSLGGKTGLILGYGAVGKRIAAVLEALGMRIIGIRRNPMGPGEYGPADLAQLLPQADVLMVTIPLTPETKGMIGAEELALLPDGAILINVARAQIVDEKALYEALKSGKLHSAGLDVWYRYPQEEGTAVPTYFVAPPSASNTPPSDYPFNEIRTLVMSPHRGGATSDTETRRVEHLAMLILAATKGEPVPNKVNLDLGY